MKVFANVFRRESPQSIPTLDEPSPNRFSSWIKFKPTKTSKALPQVIVPAWSTAPISDDDDSDSDPYDEPRPQPAPSPARRSTPPMPSHTNMRAITLAAINQRPPCPPPFVHAPSGPLFPRSINPAHSLPVVHTTRLVHHKSSLVRRLENRSLTPCESESIAAFGRRPHHHANSNNAARKRGSLEDEDVSDLLKKNERRVQNMSHGVRKWIRRPCFEERCVSWVWQPQQATYACRPIVGSDKAVAALEFSPGLEAMAGVGVVPDTPLPETAHHGSLLPLNLRITTLSPPDLVPSTSSSTPNLSPCPLTPTSPSRKAVRLSPSRHPSDDEDNVPLGYRVLNRREQEERERKEREEERRKKIYAAEVVAARARRENARAGIIEKEPARHHSRPAHDLSIRSLSSEPDVRQAPDAARTRRLLSSSRSISEEIVQDAKRQRRTSAVSESGGGSVSGRSSLHRHSLGIPPKMSPVPPVPPMPMMPVIPIPVFVPNPYFMPTTNNTTMMPPLAPPPPLPASRPTLIVSRSAERLPSMTKSESGRRPSAYRRATVQVTPSSGSRSAEAQAAGSHARRESAMLLKPIQSQSQGRRASMQVPPPPSSLRGTALVHSSLRMAR